VDHPGHPHRILFLGSNYYLWLGMERIPGAERYRKYVPPMLIILTIGFMVWATPRSMVVTLDEARAMGGTHHPLLGFFGVMSAKNTVVNLMILTTFLSYILYRRPTRSGHVVGEDRHGHQWAASAPPPRRRLLRRLRLLRGVDRAHRLLGLPGAGGHRRIVVVMAIDVPDVQGRALHR
jgi:hypothetical protein